MSRPRIVAVIDNTNMSSSHDGLGRIARKLKIAIDTLERNDLIVFLNRAKTRMKVLGGAGSIIGYVRMPKNQVLPLDAVQYLPEVFATTGKIDVAEAIKKSVTARLQAGPARWRALPEMERIG